MIQSDRERLHRLSIERKEISSEDGKIKVTVSGMWAKMPELNKEATLQVGYKGKEMYLIVLSDAKSDFQNLTLEKHHQLTRDRNAAENEECVSQRTCSVDDRWSFRHARRIKRDERRHERCFSSYHRG